MVRRKDNERISRKPERVGIRKGQSSKISARVKIGFPVVLIMEIYYSSKFEKEYLRLSTLVKMMAEKKEKIFRENPFHPSLETHKLKGALKDFWAFSINRKYRIIFEFTKSDIAWFHSVGDHSIYALWD